MLPLSATLEPSLYLTYGYVYELILAQTLQNVNGYMLQTYCVISVAFMLTVSYYRDAPVWTRLQTTVHRNKNYPACETG